MKVNNLFNWVFLLSACALLAIGRVYDERFTIYSVNLVIVLSLVYISALAFILFSVKSIVWSKSKLLFYSLYLFMFVSTPVLWIVFDVNLYGFEKFMNFWIIVVPLTFIVAEMFDSKQVMKMFFVLLGVSCFLALLSVVGLSVSERADGRMATLGGGPIVFARWMGFGIITLLLLPYKFKSWFKYLMLVTFLILALASGSRGPILALFIIGILYLGLNFNRIIVKVSLGVVLISLFILISGVGEKISGVGNFDRVFMNVSKKGGSKQSTSTRTNLAIGSLILLQHYPLGVGAGNWQQVSNEIRPTHLMPLEYPHNLFLEVACEYGLHVLFILVLLFIFIIHLSYVKMIKYKDKNSLYPLLFYLLIFLSLNSLVSGMLNDSRLLFIIISMVLINKPLIILTKSNG